MLEGQQLLDVVHSEVGESHNTLAKICGYDDTELFSDALMAARLFNGEYTDSEGNPTMDVELLERIVYTCECTQAQAVDIARELRDDYSIIDAEDWDDYYAYYSDAYGWEAEFAQFWLCEVCENEIPEYIVVDWDATWRCNLRYDFHAIEAHNGTLIIHNH